MSRLITIFTVCLVNLFLFKYLKYETKISLSEFSCLSEYTRPYPIFCLILCFLVQTFPICSLSFMNIHANLHPQRILI